MSHERHNSLAEVFGEPIHTYTRAQAIEDGVLVAIGELDAQIAGFLYPLAVNASVYNGASAEIFAARFAMLQQVRAAVVSSQTTSCDRVYFDLALPDGRLLPVVLHCGPGDAGEPVLTLCEPGDL